MSSAPPSAAVASSESAAAATAVAPGTIAAPAPVPAAVPPASVHLDNAFLPPFLAHLLNGGTAPYTTVASLGPLQSRSAGALFAGPVSSLYAGASSTSSPTAARPPPPLPSAAAPHTLVPAPLPPPAATHPLVPAPPLPTAAHPMMRAVVPAPAAPTSTTAGPANADTAPTVYAGYGGYPGYPLYGAPYGPPPTALPSYGAFHGQGAYAAAPPYGASPSPYGASPYGVPHTYGAPSLYPAAGVPSPSAPPPASYMDVEAALAAISSPPFLFSHLLPVKLKPDNYLYWRAQVLPLLRSHYLEGFVDGTLPCPPPHHPMFRAWIAQDQAILSAIQSSLGEGVAGLVLFAATSHEVWDTLESSFSSQSTAQSMAIRTKLADTRKDNGTIAAYYNKVKKLADTLASIGEPLRDTEFTAYILAGLDSDYDSLAEVIKERKVPIRPQDLYNRLLSTEQRLNARRPDISSDTSVNAAYRGKGAARGPPAAPSTGGSTKPGAPPVQQQAARPGSSVVVVDGRPRACCAACGAAQPCQLCGLLGHVASRCHRRFKTDFLGLGNNGKGNDRQVHMAHQGHTPSYPVDSSWYMDTGATDHVTHELDKLAVQQPYHGHDKVLGDARDSNSWTRLNPH
ncbi:hypothetical protein QYE76_043214 [Lolium multiflorum]|uniref:Uncharacterized protein n=1 Tax=Lolium multiflorum TaxID=4521 RepID=A0AAD8WXQ2_LOLMU|nr:hypothetical protein QYE76_043214 [Lolium multiflorum]